MAYPNLRAELERYGVKHEEVAERVGVSPKTMSQWMTGKSVPTVGVCFRIRDEFFPNMSVDYLFSDEAEAINSKRRLIIQQASGGDGK